MSDRHIDDVEFESGEKLETATWERCSSEYQKLPLTIRALKLILPIKVKTKEGIMRGDAGDWLIQGVAGEFYPCKPEIFKKLYLPIRDR